MTRAPASSKEPSKLIITKPTPSPTHHCSLCPANFVNVFALRRHLLRQHWFESQSTFTELNTKEGLTEKQSAKLIDLYKKLKDRNSPTPPRKSKRTKHNVEGVNGGNKMPKVTNMKDYKLVTVDDMSDAYRDKYSTNPPGGYTIFHFKVPKKNQNCTAPQLTAVKKRYQQNGDDNKGNKTEKIPVSVHSKLSSWQQKSFEEHLKHSINQNSLQGKMSLILTTQANKAPLHVTVDTLHRSKSRPPKAPVSSASSSLDLITTLGSQSPIMSSGSTSSATHSGCGKCRRLGSSSSHPAHSYNQAKQNAKKLSLNFNSPLVSSNFNCTDILQCIINNSKVPPKPKATLESASQYKELKRDEIRIDLTPTLPSSFAKSQACMKPTIVPPTFSLSIPTFTASPGSSKENPIKLTDEHMDPKVALLKYQQEFLTVIGLEMVLGLLESQHQAPSESSSSNL